MRLDHINIHARDQEGMRDFFITLLGLKVGWRPNFSFAGYWLYDGEQAIIHLQDKLSPAGHGWVDHICFGPYMGVDAKRAELLGLGLRFTETRLPDTDIAQFFVDGPEGVKVEIQARG